MRVDLAYNKLNIVFRYQSFVSKNETENSENLIHKLEGKVMYNKVTSMQTQTLKDVIMANGKGIQT